MSEKPPSSQLTHAIHLLDQLNTQIGITGALVVSQYNQQKQAAQPPQPPQYYPYPPMPYGQPYPPSPYYPPQPGYPPQPQTYATPPTPTSNSQTQQPDNNPQTASNQPQLPPLAQDFASLANILTQVQYDLFDINVTLAQQQLPEQIDSRIDDKAIAWMTDIITKISSQLPAHQDPILPIGNEIATNFYLAKNITQQALLTLESIPESENNSQIGSQSELHTQYLTQLQSFMFTCFRWANLILKERDWYWKPKSQMQAETPPANSQTPSNTQTVYSNTPSNSYQTPQDQPSDTSRN